MAATSITIVCPSCGIAIACDMILTVDTMPTPGSTGQDWRGSVSVDNAPIGLHLLSHYVPDSPASVSTKTTATTIKGTAS